MRCALLSLAPDRMTIAQKYALRKRIVSAAKGALKQRPDDANIIITELAENGIHVTEEQLR